MRGIVREDDEWVPKPTRAPVLRSQIDLYDFRKFPLAPSGARLVPCTGRRKRNAEEDEKKDDAPQVVTLEDDLRSVFRASCERGDRMSPSELLALVRASALFSNAVTHERVADAFIQATSKPATSPKKPVPVPKSPSRKLDDADFGLEGAEAGEDAPPPPPPPPPPPGPDEEEGYMSFEQFCRALFALAVERYPRLEPAAALERAARLHVVALHEKRKKRNWLRRGSTTSVPSVPHSAASADQPQPVPPSRELSTAGSVGFTPAMEADVRELVTDAMLLRVGTHSTALRKAFLYLARPPSPPREGEAPAADAAGGGTGLPKLPPATPRGIFAQSSAQPTGPAGGGASGPAPPAAGRPPPEISAAHLKLLPPQSRVTRERFAELVSSHLALVPDLIPLPAAILAFDDSCSRLAGPPPPPPPAPPEIQLPRSPSKRVGSTPRSSSMLGEASVSPKTSPVQRSPSFAVGTPRSPTTVGRRNSGPNSRLTSKAPSPLLEPMAPPVPRSASIVPLPRSGSMAPRRHRPSISVQAADVPEKPGEATFPEFAEAICRVAIAVFSQGAGHAAAHEALMVDELVSERLRPWLGTLYPEEGKKEEKKDKNAFVSPQVAVAFAASVFASRTGRPPAASPTERIAPAPSLPSALPPPSPALPLTARSLRAAVATGTLLGAFSDADSRTRSPTPPRPAPSAPSAPMPPAPSAPANKDDDGMDSDEEAEADLAATAAARARAHRFLLASQQLRDRYGLSLEEDASLRSIFLAYCAVGDALSPSSLAAAQFYRLLRDCRLVDAKFPRNLVDVVWASVAHRATGSAERGSQDSGGESRGSPAKHDKKKAGVSRVPYAQFIELLQQVALRRLPGTDNPLQRLLAYNIFPNAQRLEGEDGNPDEQLQIQQLFVVCENRLRKTFLYFAAQESPNIGSISFAEMHRYNASMQFSEFKLFCTALHVLPDLVTLADLSAIFKLANVASGSDEYIDDMSFEEFELATGRLAILAYSKPPYRDIHRTSVDKVRAFLTRVCDLKFKKEARQRRASTANAPRLPDEDDEDSVYGILGPPRGPMPFPPRRTVLRNRAAVPRARFLATRGALRALDERDAAGMDPEDVNPLRQQEEQAGRSSTLRSGSKGLLLASGSLRRRERPWARASVAEALVSPRPHWHAEAVGESSVVPMLVREGVRLAAGEAVPREAAALAEEAASLHNDGDLEEALASYEAARRLCLRHLNGGPLPGLVHAYFAVALGGVYESMAVDPQGPSEEARAEERRRLLRLAAAGYRAASRALRPYRWGHPDVAVPFGALGQLHYAAGDAERALRYFTRACIVRDHVLGNGHPDTAGAYNNVGCCMERLGRLSDAVDVYGVALRALREAGLGSEANPRFLVTQRNYTRALKRRTRVDVHFGVQAAPYEAIITEHNLAGTPTAERAGEGFPPEAPAPPPLPEAEAAEAPPEPAPASPPESPPVAAG